jgi:hypothetical protein
MPALDEAAGSARRASRRHDAARLRLQVARLIVVTPAEAKDWRSRLEYGTQIVYFAGIEVEGVGQLLDLVATAG